MKIEIYKKENDENVYFSYNDKTDIILNFDNLKELSKVILDKKKNGETFEYEIEVNDSELSLYKSTVNEIVKSINEDEELLHLYIEKTNNSENEEV